jgi:tetratricopeptide (TPR) repeat protein
MFSVIGKPVFEFNKNCQTAYRLVIDFRFEESERLLASELSEHPDNVIPHYIRMKRLFLQTFISEEMGDFVRFKQARETLLNQLEGSDEKNAPYPLYFKSETALCFAILKIKFNEMLSAAYEFRKAYKLINENSRLHPAFLQNNKTAGILHALIGAVPSRYKWLIHLLGFSGTIEGGMSELEQLYILSQTDPAIAYLKEEMLFLTGFLKWHIQNSKEEAQRMADVMRESDSPLLHFGAASIYLYKGENEKAIQLLSNQPVDETRFRLLYLEFLLGSALLNKMDTRADHHFDQYILHFKGTSFVRAAYQKKGWVALLNGDTAAYRKAMKQIITARGDFTDEDKQALQEAQNAAIPHTGLLRSRLLFDGGYYREALKILALLPAGSLNSVKEQVEYIYRLARVYEKLNDREKAIRYYMETIRLGKQEPWYFAANSALMLGQLYENEKDYTRAAHYYNLCIDMKNHEYENSIEQKAQAGLNRIGKQKP